AERNRVPKREVPTYRVLEPSGGAQAAIPEEEEESHEIPMHHLFVGNIPYQLTKAEIVSWLSATCDVRGLDVPAGIQYGSPNRGFAFATVGYSGQTAELVKRLDGSFLQGRRIHVTEHRDRQA